jgi:chromosomal replication initiator protein
MNSIPFPIIIQVVAEFYRVPVAEVLGRNRQHHFALPRHVCCYFGRRYTQLSLEAIGANLHRDHTTVLHGCRTVADQMGRLPDFAEQVRYLDGEMRRVANGAVPDVLDSGAA